MGKPCLLTECGNEREEEVDGSSRRWNHSDQEREDAIKKGGGQESKLTLVGSIFFLQSNGRGRELEKDYRDGFGSFKEWQIFEGASIDFLGG